MSGVSASVGPSGVASGALSNLTGQSRQTTIGGPEQLSPVSKNYSQNSLITQVQTTGQFETPPVIPPKNRSGGREVRKDGSGVCMAELRLSLGDFFEKKMIEISKPALSQIFFKKSLTLPNQRTTKIQPK